MKAFCIKTNSIKQRHENLHLLFLFFFVVIFFSRFFSLCMLSLRVSISLSLSLYMPMKKNDENKTEERWMIVSFSLSIFFVLRNLSRFLYAVVFSHFLSLSLFLFMFRARDMCMLNFVVFLSFFSCFVSYV